MSEPIQEDPRAVSAGEEDHTDPWRFAGEDADAPTNPEDDAPEVRGLLAPAVPREPGDVIRQAAAWRNCQASITLVNAINARWPGRDKSSDGTIGDAAHATRISDHNPWIKDSSGMGVVRARDVDKDGIDAAWIVEELRKLGAAGDRRLRNDGYVIFNRRITRPDFTGWQAYSGTNPHDKHFHTSFSLDQPGYDDTSPWAFLSGGVAPTPAPPPAPTPSPSGFGLPAGHYYGLISGPAQSHGGINASERAAVRLIQQRLQQLGYAPAGAGWADGVFEQPTADAVAAWQKVNMPGTTFYGQVWGDDWAKLFSGSNQSKPAPAPAPAPGRVVPAWTLPTGHYYGLITGPARSHGGINAAERAAVKLIQQALQRWGYAPASAGWADGKFEQATANAVAAWQRHNMPGTTFFGQVWADDWRKLLSR